MSFFNQVLEIVKCIPAGRVTTYGAIAKVLGAPQNSRMVGWALGNSSFQAVYIPAHRVVNRLGVLSAKANFGPGDEMKNLLIKEGIDFMNDRILDFGKVFWDPEKELKL